MQTLEDSPTSSEFDAMPPETPPSRRKAVMVGVGVGIVLVVMVVAWLGWRSLTTPPRPRLETAPVEELVAYLIEPRGFGDLAKFDQDRFFDDLKRHYRQDQPHRALKKYLDACSEERLNAVRDVLEPVILRQVIGTAREYQSLPSEKRFAFLSEFRTKAEADARWLSGEGDPEKDLRGRLSTGLPSTPEQLMKFINAKIKPDDLQAITVLVDDMKRAAARERKDRN